MADGSCKVEDLCRCNLDAKLHTQEISRRIRLGAVGDPRLDPSFASLSTKSKMLRMIEFSGGLSTQAMDCIANSGWFYRMITFTLSRTYLRSFPEDNPIAFLLFITCIFVDLLRKEFCSVGSTPLLDIALQVLQNSSEEVERERYRELLNDDEAAQRRHFLATTRKKRSSSPFSDPL